jgi:hypothetical protein
VGSNPANKIPLGQYSQIFLFANEIENLFDLFEEMIRNFINFIRYLKRAKSYLSEKSLAAYIFLLSFMFLRNIA